VEQRAKRLYRAKVAGRLLAYVPFLRLAGLNGSLVRGDDNEQSDVDFLIIAVPGRLYTARFFSHLLIHLTGWRRYGRKTTDRICLNCYLTAIHPNITPRNPASLFKVAQSNKYMIPLVDDGQTAHRFFKTNEWFSAHQVENREVSQRIAKQLLGGKPPCRPKYILEKTLGGKFGDWLEQKLMTWQQHRIRRGIREGDETLATVDEIRSHPHKFSAPL